MNRCKILIYKLIGNLRFIFPTNTRIFHSEFYSLLFFPAQKKTKYFHLLYSKIFSNKKKIVQINNQMVHIRKNRFWFFFLTYQQQQNEKKRDGSLLNCRIFFVLFLYWDLFICLSLSFSLFFLWILFDVHTYMSP